MLCILIRIAHWGNSNKYSIYQYSWLSLSRPRLSRITAYLEVKIWSLPKHENLTTGKKILWKRGEIAPKGAISPLFHNIFNISITSRVQLHIYLLNVVVRIIFSSILQIWYVEVRISRSISEGPLEFEISRVDCILDHKDILKLSPFASWSGAMINPQWLELPISRAYFNGPKDVGAIGVWLDLICTYAICTIFDRTIPQLIRG